MAAASPKIFVQALISFVQLFACTIATGSPCGVATMSISLLKALNGFCATIIKNAEVPAETFAVHFSTLFVAVIPVPRSEEHV